MGPSGPRKSLITRRRAEPKPRTTDLSQHAPDASPDAPDRFVTIEGIDGQGRAPLSACRPIPFRQRGLRVVSTRERGGSPFAEKIRTLILEQGDSESERRRVTPRLRPAGRARRRRGRRPTGSGDGYRSRGDGHGPRTGTCTHAPEPRDGTDGPASTDHGTSVEHQDRFALPSSGCAPSRSPVCTAS